MKDIANEAGVSTATVSRVLNTPEIVSPETRIIVESLINKYNYSSNSLARELATNNTNLIGVFISRLTNTYIPAVIDSFAMELEKYNYNIFTCITGTDIEKEKHYINIMSKRRVEAIVLIGSRIINSPNNELFIKINKRIPVVKMGYAALDPLYNVGIDECLGLYKATEYLIKLGHKRIAFLNGDERLDSYYNRKVGFVKAMNDYGVEIQEKYYITSVITHLNGAGGYHGAMQLMNLHEKPTGIVTAGDQIALGVYSAIQSSGYKIPDDISVIGFSGSPLSEAIYPSLTTINQYAMETGIETARLLVKVLKNEAAERNIKFEPTLIERKSCKLILA
ncbi:MAG: LacI family DNA-binding transcriptional regulator [Christensenellales bacterium]